MNDNERLIQEIQRTSNTQIDMVIYFIEFGGFFILIWGISDLLKEDKQGKENKYFISAIRIIVGSIFLGSNYLYFEVMM